MTSRAATLGSAVGWSERVRGFGLSLAWLIAVLAAALVTLHGLAILPLARESIRLSIFKPHDGVSYFATLPPRSPLAPWEPAERLLENGRPVPYPNGAGDGSVARYGRGRYWVAGNTIFLSAIDNSDPRSNGRVYTVVRPRQLPGALVLAVWAAALCTTAGMCVRHWRTILAFSGAPPLAVAVLVLLAIVAANRAWLFVDYPVAAIHPDSGGYYYAAEKIGWGVWPNFGNRPPVYPLFLKSVFTVVDRMMAVVVCQTAISVLAGLALVTGVYRWSRGLAVPAAAMTALFLCGFTVIEHDTAMLSESLYTSFLMCTFAALLLGLRERGRAGWLGVASVGMALAILTRPAGMFLLATYLLVVGGLLWNRFRRRTLAAFFVPMPALLFLMCIYNWRIVGAFTPSTWGEANLAVATFVYWDRDPAYPAEINADVREIQQIIQQRFSATGKDPSILDTSWDPDALSSIFVESFNAGALDIAQNMGGHYETAGRAWIRRIAFDSMRRRPLFYVKFVYAMLYNYFKPGAELDFRLYLQNRVQRIWIDRAFSPSRGIPAMVRLGKEFAEGTPPPNVVVTNFDPNVPMDLGERVLINPTAGWRIYDLTHRIRRYVLERWIWPIAVLGVLLSSVLVLIRSRGRHRPAFVLFVLTASVIAASLVVSLVEYSQPRYAYPMEWAYGLSAVLMPTLFRRRAPDDPFGAAAGAEDFAAVGP